MSYGSGLLKSRDDQEILSKLSKHAGTRRGNRELRGAGGSKLGLGDNCTLRDAWLWPGLSCRGQAADGLRGDDTHAGAAPPAQGTPRARKHARKHAPAQSRGDPHGWPQKWIPHLLLAQLIKQPSFPFF